MDDQLEAAIDDVGRDKVFALVHAVGWRYGHSIPKYVWWSAVVQLRKDRLSFDPQLAQERQNI